MKINKEVTFNYGLNEAHSQGMQYALLDDKGNIRHKIARCKDYIQDVYWAEILNKAEVTQYGFKWNGQNEDKISNKTRVSFVLISDNNALTLDDKIKNISNLLTPFEKKFKIKKTKFLKVNDSNTDIVVDYDNKWSEKPYMISLLFLLVRCGVFYTGKPLVKDVIQWLTNDALNLVQMADRQSLTTLRKQKKFEKIFYNKIFNDQQWKDYAYSQLAHSNSGIVSFNL